MIYFTPRMLILLLLSLISGLPLALTASTMTAWLTRFDIDIKTVGMFALVATPYAFKYIWAPLMDGFRPPLTPKFLGKRRGWMLLCIAVMAALCTLLSLIDPNHTLLLFAICATLLAFASASYDINVDAFRIESFKENEQAAAAAVTVLGYRLGMIVSTAGALTIASHFSWQVSYQTMAIIIAFGMVPLFFSCLLKLESDVAEKKPSSQKPSSLSPTAWLKQYVVGPFKQFSSHQGWWIILLFIILFKLGDAFLGFMTNPFLLKTGYTEAQIAEYVKLYGIIATITGGFVGGLMVNHIGIFRSLLIGGVIQALSNLPYAALASLSAPDEIAMGITIAIDNFCGGVSTTAFVAYISGLCNKRFTATQYALLNSLSSLGRTVVTSFSGVMVAALDWPVFFIVTALLGLPGLLLLYFLQRLQNKEVSPTSADV